MRLKTIISIVFAVVLLCSCGTERQADKDEIILFAASSLREPLTELITKYQSEHEDVLVTATFDSSGTLKAQIQAGAVCDLFISAAQTQMDILEQEAHIINESRVNLLNNQLVLVTPHENKAEIKGFADLASGKVKLISVGNADVPAGMYAAEILQNMQLWDTLIAQKKITFGTNVKEVIAQVELQAVDCGIVYATDAKTAGLPIAEVAQWDLHTPIVYPAAIIKQTKFYEKANGFLHFLSEEGRETFQKYGFVIAE